MRHGVVVAVYPACGGISPAGVRCRATRSHLLTGTAVRREHDRAFTRGGNDWASRGDGVCSVIDGLGGTHIVAAVSERRVRAGELQFRHNLRLDTPSTQCVVVVSRRSRLTALGNRVNVEPLVRGLPRVECEGGLQVTWGDRK